MGHTTFVVSMFTPRTIEFLLSGVGTSTPLNIEEPKVEHTEPVSAGSMMPKRQTLDRQLSLFKPQSDITPPKTPVEESNLDPFSSEDGMRLGLLPASRYTMPTPADRGSPEWGARRDQTLTRIPSPAPREGSALLDNDTDLTEKARILGRQGITQPKALHRSKSHDRIFAHAPWRIVDADQGNGGLHKAVEAAHREGKLGDYLWVGTLGMPTDVLDGTQQQQDIEDKLVEEDKILPVWCSDQDFDGHYVRYCKQILWPVFHYQSPDAARSKAYEDHSFKYYVKVNRAFADKVIQNWKKGDVIWIHDYHLLLVAAMVREKIPDAKIGFFLHVAFPSSEIFRCLATRNELLEGMLGANLIGFQIREYTRHFRQTCSRLLNAEATADGVQLEDRFVDVVNMPIGIDPVVLSEHRTEARVMSWLDIISEKYKGKKLIVARDKLDHVRGVRQKLLAYELFLNKNPKYRGKVVLIQVALSTSEKNELDATVSDIVTRVNSLWANLAYQPLVYLKQDIDYAQYLALLSAADALMITSQREGMNLTSHEFVTCQDGAHHHKKHGSLILSEFTGTSELFAGADLPVNPWDYSSCADAIKTALEMSDQEKAERWARLNKAVSHHTGAHWFCEFASQLDLAYERQHRREQTSVPRLSGPALVKQYSQSQRRLFMLNYEGTLVNWGPVDRVIATSPQRTLNVLKELVLDPRNIIYVMSGRHPKELRNIFRQIPHLGLIAENGCYIKPFDQDQWRLLADRAKLNSWKKSVMHILQYYRERTTGAEIEEKSCSVVFHYSGAHDKEAASRIALECASHINDACEEQRVQAKSVDGKIIIESIDWTKRKAAERIFTQLQASNGPIEGRQQPIDFLMVAGDGRDDEKVFNWANDLGHKKVVEEVVTVSLHCKSTEASATCTQGVSGIRSALEKLAAAN